MKWRALKLLKIIIHAIVDTIGLLKTKKAKFNQKQQMIANFAPDEIVSTEIFHGRFFLCSQHALWEIFEDEDILRIKLITHTEESKVKDEN